MKKYVTAATPRQMKSLYAIARQYGIRIEKHHSYYSVGAGPNFQSQFVREFIVACLNGNWQATEKIWREQDNTPLVEGARAARQHVLTRVAPLVFKEAM